MSQLLIAIERDEEPEIGGRDNLNTMALVDAAYRSAEEHRAVTPVEISNSGATTSNDPSGTSGAKA